MSGIVDVYDAVTADRVYKQGMQPTQAFRILLKGVDLHFDADLVTKFIKCLTSSPTLALRVTGGGSPLLGDSCSRSTGFLLHRAA